MSLPTFEQMEAARREHQITHHDEGGYMWSSCSCGWASRKLDAYHNYQVTQSIADGDQHQLHKMRTSHLKEE